MMGFWLPEQTRRFCIRNPIYRVKVAPLAGGNLYRVDVSYSLVDLQQSRPCPATPYIVMGAMHDLDNICAQARRSYAVLVVASSRIRDEEIIRGLASSV